MSVESHATSSLYSYERRILWLYRLAGECRGYLKKKELKHLRKLHYEMREIGFWYSRHVVTGNNIRSGFVLFSNPHGFYFVCYPVVDLE